MRFRDKDVVERYKRASRKKRPTMDSILARQDYERAMAAEKEAEEIEISLDQFEAPVFDDAGAAVEEPDMVFGSAVSLFEVSDAPETLSGKFMHMRETEYKISYRFNNHSSRELWLKAPNGVSIYLDRAKGEIRERLSRSDDYLAVEEHISIRATKTNLRWVKRLISEEKKRVCGDIKKHQASRLAEYYQILYTKVSERLMQMDQEEQRAGRPLFEGTRNVPMFDIILYKFYNLAELNYEPSIFLSDIGYLIVDKEENLNIPNPLRSKKSEQRLMELLSDKHPQTYLIFKIYGDENDPDSFKMAVGSEIYQIPVVKTAGGERRYVVKVYRRDKDGIGEPELIDTIEGSDFNDLSRYGIFKDNISMENHHTYLQRELDQLKEQYNNLRKDHIALRKDYEALKAERNEWKAKYEEEKRKNEDLKKERAHTRDNIGIIANILKTIAAIITMIAAIYTATQKR